ncbi:hypothetical protein JTE90_009217 [Oedothorax gibbosus]|uniref:C3H1-type domain-containing protein n=1 Tax=Oedothorax gibbosus TaxID=931172 RepID=A0AAV6US26_9ARAC|nr:hypothetical protein JTE90_009217 [Oedothorax gibbosus]
MTTAALVSAFTPDFRNLYNFKGLQSQQAARDLRQTLHVSLALERQLSGQLANNYASSLINLQNPLPSFQTNNPAPATTKQHPPLTASNSVAVCNAEANLKSLAQREHRKLDRSVSEPVDNKQRQTPNSSRYKTELCRPFEESGTCKYGDKCQFAHGFAELRTLSRHPKYKTELCRTFHSTGFCPYGPRCHFIHNSEDSKKCLLDTLQTGNGNGSLSPTSMTDYDICGFSIGSAGELSPTGSISSGGGSPMSNGGFFYDGPKTAPPTMSNGGFFSSGDLKPLSIISHDDYLSTSSEDEVMSSLGALVSEMDLDEPEPEEHGPAGQKPAEPVDINRNLIRLPIFSRLSLGSSP